MGSAVPKPSQEAKPEPEWPAHFPKDCPASENADPVMGAVFQLLRHTANDDFTTAYDRNVFTDRPQCQRVSYSCYRSEAAARHHLSLQPSYFRAVARAELEPKHGVIKATPTNKFLHHHSLWLRAAFEALGLFVEMLP